MKKVTGKYSCSISEINGPIKTIKPSGLSQSKRALMGPSISIKEENLLAERQDVPTASLHSEHRLDSQGSKGISSENSKNLSEMSLILTPMQVKLKRDKFTKSAKKLASMKSRFGSMKHAEHVLAQSSHEQLEKRVENKTAFERMMSRLSRESGKRKESANLTQKTDLSGSSESFTKMFKELKISLDSTEKCKSRKEDSIRAEPTLETEIYSQKSNSDDTSENKCFLDEVFEKEPKQGPFPSFLHKPQWRAKNSQNAEQVTAHWGNRNDWSQATHKSISKDNLWRSAESAEINELSSDLKGGFDLMRIIDKPGLYSNTRRSHAFRDQLGLQGSNGMVSGERRTDRQTINSIESNPKRSEKRSKELISGESSDFKLWNKAFGQEEFKPKDSDKGAIEGFTLSGMPRSKAQNSQMQSVGAPLSSQKTQVKSQIENVQIDKPRNSQSSRLTPAKSKLTSMIISGRRNNTLGSCADLLHTSVNDIALQERLQSNDRKSTSFNNMNDFSIVDFNQHTAMGRASNRRLVDLHRGEIDPRGVAQSLAGLGLGLPGQIRQALVASSRSEQHISSEHDEPCAEQALPGDDSLALDVPNGCDVSNRRGAGRVLDEEPRQRHQGGGRRPEPAFNGGAVRRGRVGAVGRVERGNELQHDAGGGRGDIQEPERLLPELPNGESAQVRARGQVLLGTEG